MRARDLAVVASLLAACAEDADVTGIYRVTSHLRDEAGCGAGAEVALEPYFMLQKQYFFFEFVALSRCDDATAETCSGGGLLDGAFTMPSPEGWTGESFTAFTSGGGPCVLVHAVQSATLQSGGLVKVELERREAEDPSLEGDACSAEAAEAKGDSLPCVAHETLLGEKVADAPAP